MKKSIFHNAMRRKRFFAIQLAIQCLLLLPLSVASTYTWFFLSKTPSVNDMRVQIKSMDGLKIAWEKNPEQWEERLNYQDVVSANTVLRPVTYSYRNDAFYIAKYNNSGRIVSFDQRIDEKKNANREDDQSYILKFTFFAHTDADVTVNLSDSLNGTGTFLCGELGWDEDSLSNYTMTSGVEMAMRIGLRICPLDENGEEIIEEKSIVVYEPNSDLHLNGKTGYKATPSIDGTANLLPEERIYAQSVTTWEEQFPVKKGEVNYSYGQFLTENEPLFSLSEGNTAKIDVIIWLEGQDEDCSNVIGEDKSQIFAHLSLLSARVIDPGYVD